MPCLRCLVPIVTIALVGCASPKLVNTGAVDIVSADMLPQPTTADLISGVRPNLIGPGDLLSLEVFGLAELSREVRVDSNGMVSLPLAGPVSAVGLTPERLAAVVQEKLRASYVRNPRVTVSVVETVSQVVTVEGQVKRAGIYPVVGEMSLMRAIARAEGTSDTADSNRVVVFRKVQGRSMAALYDLRAIQLGAYKDPTIYSNDVVVVGESTARRLFPQIIQAAGLILTPIITVLKN